MAVTAASVREKVWGRGVLGATSRTGGGLRWLLVNGERLSQQHQFREGGHVACDLPVRLSRLR